MGDESKAKILRRVEELCPSDEIIDFMKGKPLRHFVIYHPPFMFFGCYASMFQEILRSFKDAGLDCEDAISFVLRAGVQIAHKEIMELKRGE